MKNFLIALSCCVMTACAGPLRNSYSPTDPNAITVVKDLPAGFELLQRVSVTSCSSSPFGTYPDRKVMLADMKKEAAKIGATGLYEVSYNPTGLLQKCVLLLGTKATAIAFRASR